MHHNHAAHAYLVKAYLRTSSGALLAEPDTICFDLDLALEIAENDRHYAAGLAVYALGEDGELLADFPLISHGTVVPAPVMYAQSAAMPGAVAA
ncbi:hypothetical protein GCM10007301_37300 [Azorhizobium oxalatiphilum]|uniref:Uncharacterized protein n=1 Tax=Azorhizobium oxalatiphilum TaxID=980631 RepID=A0A917FGL2_9HYPH|nr:hypothetical protein [Azorhizobium oxalatiphilum]GGF74029.1 hypothetical protein GCM10007301_37300 [Azorhizobium oxalatiphilum]